MRSESSNLCDICDTHDISGPVALPGGSARRLARILEKRSGLAASDRRQRVPQTPLSVFCTENR